MRGMESGKGRDGRARRTPVGAASAAAAALCLLICSCASFEIKPVTEYQPNKDGEKKNYQMKKLRVAVEGEPDRGVPAISFRVERCQVDYMWRKSVTRRYKIWDDGRPKERADQTEKTSIDTILAPEPLWVPWKGQKIQIRVSESKEVFEVETDEQGAASFDVSRFSQCWIEGRDLIVDYRSNVPDYPAMPETIWEDAKKKKMSMPDFMKALGKLELKDVEGRLTVGRAVLEKIFERIP